MGLMLGRVASGLFGLYVNGVLPVGELLTEREGDEGGRSHSKVTQAQCHVV